MTATAGPLLVVLGALSFGRPTAASGAPACITAALAPVTPGGWNAPLDRIVTFHVRDISLREALDRLAAAGHVRLSYSPESLPLDRAVCIAFDSVALGLVLTRLLDGVNVTPVIAAADHVVLAPARLDMNLTGSNPIVLDRIVVTGTAAGAAQRPLPVAIDVVDGRQLEARSVGTMAQALNGAVPGVWLWEQSPSNLVAGYASIRGASSFGLTYPKVYIDGIEVANPLLLTRLTPDAIERVEVIRGPQGAALYGADAISGVTNIVTRLGVTDGNSPRVWFESGLGLSTSEFSPDQVLAQRYLLALRSGTNTRSAGLTIAGESDGAFVPGAYARRLDAAGSARNVGSKSILTGTLRLYAARAAAPLSPILIDSLASSGSSLRLIPAPQVQSVVEYTAGTTFKLFPGDRWIHTVVAGIDGYSLDGVPDDRTPIPAAADSALRAARGDATRGTLRLSSSVRVGLGTRASTDLTLLAEQSVLRQATAGQSAPLREGEHQNAYGFDVTQWRSTSGVSALASTTWLERFFVSGGVRVERATAAEAVAIPMLGGAWAAKRGAITLKLRAAYGDGVRWPQTTARQAFVEGVRPGTSVAGLTPERQSGVEGGFDLMVGRALTLQVTRFDQTASGLIQWVSVPGDSTGNSGPGGGGGGGSGPGRRIGYEFQNVGEITNRGWEVQGALTRRGLSVIGTVSLVDSRVRRLANGYTGDLETGDRMLQVPARTMSLTAAWSGSRWSGSVTAYRAEDWINYDRLGLAQAFRADSEPARSLVGPALRPYWLTYPGVTHLRATASWSLSPRLVLTVRGDNLLNQQTGEPDNVTVLPGRTISLSLRAGW